MVGRGRPGAADLGGRALAAWRDWAPGSPGTVPFRRRAPRPIEPLPLHHPSPALPPCKSQQTACSPTTLVGKGRWWGGLISHFRHLRNEQARQAPGLTGAGRLTPPSAASLWARSRARSPAESCPPATPVPSDQHLQSPEPPRRLAGRSGSPHGTISLCEFHILETLLDPSVGREDPPGKGHPACSHLAHHLPTARGLRKLTSRGSREHAVSATPPATLVWAKAPPRPPTEKGMSRALREAGEGTAQQEEDPAVMEEDGQEGARVTLAV